MSTTETTTSHSVAVRPSDSRCKYWAKVVRAGSPLPLPSDIGGASDIPGAYLPKGDEELFAGDVLFEGEEMHHRKARGWFYSMYIVNAAGDLLVISGPTSKHKAELKAAGLAPELLAGSGDVAAMVRIAHGIRAGLTVTE